MKFTSDTLATATGVGMAVMQSANTVAAQMAPGASLHTQDYVNLAMSVAWVFYGWITNRQPKVALAGE